MKDTYNVKSTARAGILSLHPAVCRLPADELVLCRSKYHSGGQAKYHRDTGR